jgi:hypothetical protein
MVVTAQEAERPVLIRRCREKFIVSGGITAG